MFNPLDDAQLEIVIDAMDSKTYNPGDAVITQGEEGNELYVVEEGTLACFKLFVSKNLSDLNSQTGEDVAKYLRDYNPGDAFGELALLYGAPRAATIVSKTPSHLWALDRSTFNHIVKGAAA